MMFSKVLKGFNSKPTTTSFSKLLTARKTTTNTAPTAAFSTATVSENNQHAPWGESKILLTGCQGQIGVPLVRALCKELGSENVIASDVGE